MKKLLKLLPSDRVEGDLIARVEKEGKGSLIVIIDSKNPQFAFAEAEQVWLVDYSMRQGWALGSLVREIDIDFVLDFDKHGPRMILVDPGSDQDLNCVLELPRSGKITEFQKMTWEFYLEKAQLENYSGMILDAAATMTQDAYDALAECSEFVAEVKAIIELTTDKKDWTVDEETWIYSKTDPLGHTPSVQGTADEWIEVHIEKTLEHEQEEKA